MAERLKWRTKRDVGGKEIPNCWECTCGYTVALCRLPNARYTITRPGGSVPFAYTGQREDIVPLIEADIAAAVQFPAGEGA